MQLKNLVNDLILLYFSSVKTKNTNMLQDKDIAKSQEIKTFFTDSWIQSEFFSKQLELFDFTKASRIFQAVKKSGVPIWDIIRLLLVLPFSNAQSIHRYTIQKWH